MKMTPELTRLAESVTTLRREFDEANVPLKDKLDTVQNLLDTRKKLEEEAGRQSNGWEQSLLASGGVESEDSDKASLLASLAKEKLGRISPLIEAARVEALKLRYSTAEKARRYDFAWHALCSALIRPECEALINDLRESLEIVRGLLVLSRVPTHELDNLLTALMGDIARENNLNPAQEYLAMAEGDTGNPLHLWPGVFPAEASAAIRLSPSAGQMALARKDTALMQALAEGREPCKGLN
ncbi:TPA: hypothetical protein RQO64_002349 [Klebsiella oxytoca]|nr:hypothetical protein [Klebsiella oxytoca]